MPAFCFNENRFALPPVETADEDGLVLIGGKPTPQRVPEAYAKGIFPWYDNDSFPLWYSPNPRFVLFPTELHVSRSMKKVLTKAEFVFKTNTAFEEVLASCASVVRKDQQGTWLTTEMKAVYLQLHYSGFAHSAETWFKGELVGGVYGLRIGNVFFGESMFSKVNNASKFAFIKYVQQLTTQGLKLVDCQVYTPHVESLGGRLIDRADYLRLLKAYI